MDELEAARKHWDAVRTMLLAMLDRERSAFDPGAFEAAELAEHGARRRFYRAVCDAHFGRPPLLVAIGQAYRAAVGLFHRRRPSWINRFQGWVGPGEAVTLVSACHVRGTPHVAAVTREALYFVARDASRPRVGRIPFSADDDGIADHVVAIEPDGPTRSPAAFTIVRPTERLRFERVQEPRLYRALVEGWQERNR